MERYINDSVIAGLFEITAVNIIFKGVVLVLVPVFFGHIFIELFDGIKNGRKQKKKMKDIIEEQAKNLLLSLLIVVVVLVVMFNFFIPIIAIAEAIAVWLGGIIIESIPAVWEWIREKIGG